MKTKPHITACLITAILLFWALGHHSNGYYTFLRWVTTIVAILTAIKLKDTRFGWSVWLFGAVAILFNPLVPVHLGHNTWTALNILTGALFVFGAITPFFTPQEKTDMPSVNWDQIKKPVLITAAALVGLGAVVFLIYIIPKIQNESADRILKNESKVRIQQHQDSLKMFQDSVWTFQFESYRFSGKIEFKLTTKGEESLYRCNFKPDSGFSFNDPIRGELHIKLRDKDGFVLKSFTISKFVHGISSRFDEQTLTLSADGKEYITLQDLIGTTSIDAPTTLKCIQSLTDGKAGTKKNIKNSIPKSGNAFDIELDNWTAKANKIIKGMTYSEMVRVAGEPRVKSTTDYFADGPNYDIWKYNYGRKWVLFKNELVHTIK